MPTHDPIPSRPKRADADPHLEDRQLADLQAVARLERTAQAWSRYRRLMSWMGLAAVATALLALIYLKSAGQPVPLHMAIATVAGVGFTVLLGTGLMGLAYFSSNSGHDDAATRAAPGPTIQEDDENDRS